MGCVCATAKRRRRQMKNGMNHLHFTQRPTRKKTDAAKSARRLARVIENARKAKK